MDVYHRRYRGTGHCGRPAQRVYEPTRSVSCGKTAKRRCASRSASVHGNGDKRSVAQTISPAIADDAVGLSNFSVADLKAMMEEVVKPIRDCVETLMDEKDAEFDVKNEVPAPPKRMSPEREARAWEDHRDEEAQLEREDNTVAPPNPLASGVDFDSITKASDIFAVWRTTALGALQFAMNVFRTVDGTQFSGCLPDALLEKLYECHRKVEMNDEAFRRVINTPKRGIGDTTLGKIGAAAMSSGTSLYRVICSPDDTALT